MNILILSCGARNKIVQYFKKEVSNKGLVIATDSDYLAPALYEADKYFIVPRIDDKEYLPCILKICRENNIKIVFSLIDPELSLLAKNKKTFLDIGVTPIISEPEFVDLSFDKYDMYEFFVRNNIDTIKSYIEKEKFFKDEKMGKISYPVFVKPRKGSASSNVSKVSSEEEIILLFNKYNDLMIQEYMDGTEYGADIYIDMISGETVSIFIKEKLKMRSGETDKSVSKKIEEIFKNIEMFIKKTKFKGILDIDIFEVNNKYYISEINPRFGGGYPHAYESGVNIPQMIVNNAYGVVNDNKIGQYDEEIFMMKYNEIKIFKK